ncbi:mitochondrial PGP phosphatase [Blastocladiella britannica]|nr:mitochondrial PGP phosphatase [Blastocladiella britannica]
MVQSLNLPGIRAFFSVLVTPALMRPAISVPDVSHIDFQALYNRGIRAIAFDKDNCLTAPYANDLHPSLHRAFAECTAAFGRDNMAVYSNSAGTPDDKDGGMAKALESSLGIAVLSHAEKKPAGGYEIAAYFRLPAHQVAFVGDRALTDVVMANRNGYLSIHTYRVLTEKGDNGPAKWVRFL